MKTIPEDETIFISHKSEDNELAVRIIEFLRKRGYPDRNLFLDIDPATGLKAGRKWQSDLYERLQNCVCLITVGTSSWVSSKWCFAEAFIAKSRGIPIISLKVDDNADLAFLSEYQAIEDFTTSEENLQRLLEALEQNHLSPPIAGEKHTEGWAHKNAELSIREQGELLEQVSRQIKRFEPDRLTRFLVIAMAISLAIAAFSYYFGEGILGLWPVDELTLTTEEFTLAAKNPVQRDGLLEKKVELHGTGISDYSATKARIKLDRIVEVNVNNMVNGEAIPESLGDGRSIRHQKLKVVGVVEQVVPTEIRGKLISVIVYMNDVEFSVED